MYAPMLLHKSFGIIQILLNGGTLWPYVSYILCSLKLKYFYQNNESRISEQYI
jgi:hypothetical protein